MKKISILLISFLMLISILPFNPQEVYAASWLEEELDGNEPFITATEEALGKNRADITLADLESIQKLLVFGSASIPNQISDYKNLTTLEARSGTITEVPDSIGELKKLETLNLNQNKLQEFPMITLQLPVLKNLYINTGNITEIPAEITTMSSHLISLDIRFQNLISLPSVIFTTSWTANADKKLIISTSENQLVSNIPQNYLDDFNNKNNMLEFYNFPPEDFRQHQDQLVYKGEAIEVPLNTDFNLLTPDKANLGLKSNKALFAQHEFVYYDDGTSSDVLVDGVATNPGSGYITIKSSLSTNSNPFAKVKVPIIVTSPVKGADITVQYVDTDGNAIAVEDVLTGNVDDNYTSSPKTIAGYTLKTTPANANGLFSDQAQTVTYVYTKDPVAAEPVTVQYVDTDGNAITTEDVLTGNVDDNYTSSPKTIAGYTLKTTPANANGLFSDQAQTVTYVYTKDPVAAEPVTVQYVDTDGNAITTEDVLTGNIGDNYTSSPKTIAGYTLKTTPANANGLFSDLAQTVTYVYTKGPVAAEPVTVQYVDIDGNAIAAEDILTGNIGDNYTTTPKTISGYKLSASPTNVAGLFTDKPQTVSYIYTEATQSSDSDSIDVDGKTSNSDDIIAINSSTNHAGSIKQNNNDPANLSISENRISAEGKTIITATSSLPKTGDTTPWNALIVGVLLSSSALVMWKKRS